MEWKKGDKTLKSSDKYRMRQEETSAELLIRDLEVEDTLLNSLNIYLLQDCLYSLEGKIATNPLAHTLPTLF